MIRNRDRLKIAGELGLKLTTLLLCTVIFGTIVCSAATSEAEVPEIVPERARDYVGKKVAIKMLVKAAKYSTKRETVYLDSEADFKDAKNLGVVIEKDVLKKFRDAGIKEPHEHFRDKKVKVTGTVELREDRPYVPISDPQEIELEKE